MVEGNVVIVIKIVKCYEVSRNATWLRGMWSLSLR